jgi:hypothetical protein
MPLETGPSPVRIPHHSQVAGQRRLSFFEKLYEFRKIAQMHVFLRHGLRNQNRIGLNFKHLLEQRLTGNLSAHVVGIDFRIALQTVVATISFHAHNGIYSHSMGITSNRGAYNR